MTTQDWWLEDKGREGRTGRGLTTQPDHDNTRLVAGGEREGGWEGLAGDSPHSQTMTIQDWWLEEKGREGGKDWQGTHHTAGP